MCYLINENMNSEVNVDLEKYRYFFLQNIDRNLSCYFIIKIMLFY